MAMTGVLRPGHVVLRVLDLEEGINFIKTSWVWSKPDGISRAGSTSRPGMSETTIAC